MSTSILFPSSVIPLPNEFRLGDRAHVLRDPFEAGYVQTRAKNQRVLKTFQAEWSAMDYDEWLELVEFFRARKGGAEGFLYQVPLALYDISSHFDGTTSKGADVGFLSEVSYSTYGPWMHVRFTDDTLTQEFDKEIKRFRVVINLEQV